MDGPIQLTDLSKSTAESGGVWIGIKEMFRQLKPVDLAMGFPDYPEVVPKTLKNALIKTQSPDAPAKENQYARSQGNVEFVNELAQFFGPLHNRELDPMKEILVTIGAYGSLICCMQTVVNPGDEVILIEPYFDLYAKIVKNLGATAKFVTLRLKPGGITASDFEFDRDEMRNAFTDKTKVIVVNTPHNPTGKVFTRDEIEFIGNLCKQHNCLYLSDEVYEWLLYDNKQHIRASTLPDMWERTLTCSSGGKAFNVTGWRIGWTIGPEYLVNAVASVFLHLVYSSPNLLQIALTETFKIERKLLGTKESYWYWLVNDLFAKRKRVYDMLLKAGFTPIMPEGGYFMMVDVKDFKPDLPEDTKHLEHDRRIMQWLLKEKGLLTIPASVFYSKDSKKELGHYLRVCFIKANSTIDEAEEKLRQV